MVLVPSGLRVTSYSSAHQTFYLPSNQHILTLTVDEGPLSAKADVALQIRQAFSKGKYRRLSKKTPRRDIYKELSYRRLAGCQNLLGSTNSSGNQLSKKSVNKKATSVHSEGYSKKDVQRAGETLIVPNIASLDSKMHLEALMVLSYWRSCHIVPLDKVVNILTAIVPRVDNTAIIAKRLKRAQSIIEKLTRNKSMKLRNMQDIGGARVIGRSIRYINKIKRELTKVVEFKITDYIAFPKDDGYRGIHLIGKFPGSDPLSVYSIEIQLRTVRMHNWATSVEIIDLFTKQSLKQGQGKPQWREFFRHASLVLAAMDGVNISKEDYNQSAAAVVNLSRKLDIFSVFEAFSDSLKLVGEYGISDREGYYLIQINTIKKTVKCNFYGVEAYDRAVEDYLRHESEITDQTAKVVALVSTLSIKDLKEAYPNYFADSADFLESIREVHEKFRNENPNWLRRFFENLMIR